MQLNPYYEGVGLFNRVMKRSCLLMTPYFYFLLLNCGLFLGATWHTDRGRSWAYALYQGEGRREQYRLVRCKCDAILSADIALFIPDRNLRLDFVVKQHPKSQL